jgi:murein DD-endopeptidase MepM/ murein hydrolase activator NlpD
MIKYKDIDLSKIPEQGRFGGRRKFDTHTGVDIYCQQGTPVTPIEPGLVVGVCDFTGPDAGSPWWLPTKAVLVEGNSGVVLYGEIDPAVKVGEYLYLGSIIGFVERVLRNDKGLPTTMLHLELYQRGYRGEGEWWREEKPSMLLNIEDLLLSL